ncbi:hypothetical protein VN97_g3784 [Penicillium thymicola]|uniref:Uncharacterized protein n=1 Tax=Penicillium thymicola TaxID=293382 RepID=A0AAI9TLG4_PENTH|nr:hypothetical protein VN97_g3784 [Penicillium thymicola]
MECGRFFCVSVCCVCVVPAVSAVSVVSCVGRVGDVERSTKPLMSLPEGSDGIDEGIYCASIDIYIGMYFLLGFLSFFIIILICLYAYTLICFISVL